jgi:Tol biopolymer transport system component
MFGCGRRNPHTFWLGVLVAVCVASLPAASAATDAVAPLPHLAFVTESANSPSTVWVAGIDGQGAQSLGLGASALLSPDGQTVAASLFGTGSGVETGPGLALYSTAGLAPRTYLDLATATIQPLAFSPDSRYLAIYEQSTALRNIARRSSLVVLDTSTGTLTTIAHGAIFGAGFAPDGSDRIAYGRSSSMAGSPSDIYIADPDGGNAYAFTHDGHSLNPVWGSRYLAFDRERLRHDYAPAFQIWLAVTRPGGAPPRRITNLRVNKLVSGLVPIAFSADGTRLVSEFEGQDTSEAWTVSVSTRHVQRLTSHGRSVVADGISRDGATVLIDEGGFEEESSQGRIATIPFSGGRSSVLVAHGAEGSWNG